MTAEVFLNKDVPSKDGILLEFIEPLEPQNNEYLVNWSEALVTIERVINNQKYEGRFLDIYEKYCTLPQKTKWCSTVKISSNLMKGLFTNLTNMLASHVNSFFKNNVMVKFMNVVFKVDSNKNIYLTYCRRLVMRPGKANSLSDSLSPAMKEQKEWDIIEKLPNFVMNSVSCIQQNPRDIRMENRCLSCLSKMSKF